MQRLFSVTLLVARTFAADANGSEVLLLQLAGSLSIKSSSTGPWSCPAPFIATDCVRSSWHGWKGDKDRFQNRCRGKLVRWGHDSGVQDCGVPCFACSYIRACCDTCVTIMEPPKAFWKSLDCVAVDVQREIKVGVTESESESFEFSESWSTSVSASAEAGATVRGVEGTIGLSGTMAQEESRKWSNAWSKTTSMEDTRTWTQPARTCGWTWSVEIVDSCGERTANTEHFELTPNGNPPCCLPGMFADSSNKYGDCLPDHSGMIVNLCKGTVTNYTTSTTTSTSTSTSTSTVTTSSSTSTSTSTVTTSSSTSASTSSTSSTTATTTPVLNAIHAGDTIWLLGHTGKYFTVSGADVQAQWHDRGSWQAFVIEKESPDSATIQSGDAIYLQAHTGKFVTVQDTEVHASWDHKGDWERLVIEKEGSDGPIYPNDTVYLRTHTGKRIAVQDTAVVAKWDEKGAWQALVIEK